MIKRSKKNNKLKGGKPFVGKFCSEISSLRGNTVTSVAFQGKNNLLATVSLDNNAKLWRFHPDGSNPVCTATANVGGHTNSVTSVAFHPTINLLATGSHDYTAKFWSFNDDGSNLVCTGTANVNGHTRGIYSVAFHPSGNLLATCSDDTTAKLWSFEPDGSNPVCAGTLTGHIHGIESVAFHPRHNLLATGSSDKTAKLWMFNPDGSYPICTATTNVNGHIQIIKSVAFHPSRNLLVTGSYDMKAKLWSFNDNGSNLVCISTLVGHTHWINSVAFYPDGNFLATGSSDNTAKLWSFRPDGSNTVCIETLTVHTDWVQSVAFHPDGQLLATGSYDRTAKLWDCSKLSTEYRRRFDLTHGSLATSLIGKITESPAVLSNQTLMRSLLHQRVGNVLGINTPASRANADTNKAEKYQGFIRAEEKSIANSDLPQCDSCKADEESVTFLPLLDRAANFGVNDEKTNQNVDLEKLEKAEHFALNFRKKRDGNSKRISKNGLRKSSQTKYYKRGGGYSSTLSVNKPIHAILKTTEHDNDKSLVFTITNKINEETIHYNNIGLLGEGGYGKVFLVTNDGLEYVIKIGHKYPEYLLKEPIVLDNIMPYVSASCNYRALSQGLSNIDSQNIGHIVFPYKGNHNLHQITLDDSKIELIPNILRDVIICLIEINKYGCHGDIKLENVVYNPETRISFIIDYGLASSFDIAISSLYNLNLGNKQLSVDCLIGYFQDKMNKNTRILYDLYSPYLDVIQKTIDNFGLFWLIIESLSNMNYHKYFLEKSGEYLVQSNNPRLFHNYLNFYFNLNPEETPLTIELQKLFSYTSKSELRNTFIDEVRDEITDEKYEMYFNNDLDLFTQFITKVLALVSPDPTMRIPKQVLLEDPFFHK